MSKPFFALIILLVLFVPHATWSASLLFQTTETSFDDSSSFYKWHQALLRYKEEQQFTSTDCHDSSPYHCRIIDWFAFLEPLRDLPFNEQLEAINHYANKHPHILDHINWGVEDYWASPGEFLLRDGDCEDYSIIKYLSLALLGIPTEQLRIVVLYDNNLNILHAVLAVYDADDIYIMDNQISHVTDHKHIFHYTPIYSINHHQWWRHY